jgi:mono/diheme cytochrome c family protein
MTSRGIHLVSILLLTGCASTVPQVTQQLVMISGKPAALLEEGRRLYGGPCSSCHTPYSPAEYSAAKWVRIVADMSERSKLSDAEHDAVLAYVLAARSMPPAAR